MNHLLTQGSSKAHGLASPRPSVPNISVKNIYIQHLFKAHGLGAELHVCRRSMSNAGLVFDGADHTVLNFYDIRSPGKPQRF